MPFEQRMIFPLLGASRNPVWRGGKIFLGPNASTLEVEIFCEETEYADTLIGKAELDLNQLTLGRQEHVIPFFVKKTLCSTPQPIFFLCACTGRSTHLIDALNL